MRREPNLITVIPTDPADVLVDIDGTGIDVIPIASNQVLSVYSPDSATVFGNPPILLCANPEYVFLLLQSNSSMITYTKDGAQTVHTCNLSEWTKERVQDLDDLAQSLPYNGNGRGTRGSLRIVP